MRTVSDDFDAALFNESTTLARVWRITRADGTVLRITDAVRDIEVNGEVFRHDMGFSSTAVHTSSLNISGQSAQFDMMLQDNGISERDIRARKYEGAQAVMLIVDYKLPSAGVMTMFRGRFGRVTLNEKGMTTIEVLSFVGKNSPLATRQYSQGCPWSLGDSNCRFAIENVAVDVVVASIVDPLTFTVDTMAGEPDDFFALGQMVFRTGANATVAVDVRATQLSTLQVALFYRPQVPVQVGDTARLYPGCDRQLQTCHDKFNNVLNFGGQPFNPQWTVQQATQ